MALEFLSKAPHFLAIRGGPKLAFVAKICINFSFATNRYAGIEHQLLESVCKKYGEENGKYYDERKVNDPSPSARAINLSS